MGCHCWTYKNIESLTDEEKQHIVDEEIDNLKNCWCFLKPTEDVIRDVETWFNNEPELYKNITETPEEYVLRLINKYTYILNKIQENGFNAVVTHKRSTFKEYDGKLYVNIDFDRPCRVYGYPEEAFTNVNKLIKWLKISKDTVGYYKDNGDFVKGFTESLENNIREYFKKHGENSLLIEFG